MKVTAITRFKHAEIYSLLQKLKWSQSDLARHSNLTPRVIGHILNLNKRPNLEQANAIQFAFGKAGIYFDVLETWPETFLGIKKGTRVERTTDIEFERLLDCREALMIAVPESIDTTELDEMLLNQVNQLTPRETKAVELTILQDKTFVEAGKEMKIGVTRVRQLQQNALRRLRHSSRLRYIKKLLSQ